MRGRTRTNGERCNVIDVYFRFVAAADKLGVSGDARRDVLAIATMAQQDGAAFAAIMMR